MLENGLGIKAWVAKSFHRFGNHCANHIIRVLLICAFVITSLAYPALAIYLNHKPSSHFSAKWFGVATGPIPSTSASTSGYVDDVTGFWSGVDSLVVDDGSVMRVRCAQGTTVRVERLVVQRDARRPRSALEKDTLLDALRIQKIVEGFLEDVQGNPLLSCVRDKAGECITLTPLSFWDSNEEQLNATSDTLRIINSVVYASKAGIRVTPDMTLSQRSAGPYINYAGSLVFTYLLKEEDCTSDTRHNEWKQLTEQLKSDAVSLLHGAGPPTLIGLQYDPTHTSSLSILSVGLYLGYIAFFIYFSGSLRKMDTVHSRWGLAFTGLVEIVASTITSASVCAIVGFSVRTVPWRILPIIIVFVGAENMFILVDAVVTTPITLPVRERIGVGLSIAGTSNTFKVVTYNAILGSIAALAPPGPIREFCTFATVVLIAHWFLIHTFFLAVLCIDIQRLELSEMISQDPSIQPASPQGTKMKREKSVSGTAQDWLRGRPARNLSLVMLLAFTALLYYLTLPPITLSATESEAVAHNLPTSKARSAAWQIWSTINPANHEFVHLRIENPTVITLLSAANYVRPAQRAHWLKSLLNTLHPIFWAIKILVFPIAATMGLLYLLLRYLLKNTELLETRQHSESDGEEAAKAAALRSDYSFTAFPRTCLTDISATATSHDGSVIASISVENEVTVWRRQKEILLRRSLDNLELLGLSSLEGNRLRSVTIDRVGSSIALGASNGRVAIWALSASESSYRATWNYQASSSVAELVFVQPFIPVAMTPRARIGSTPKSTLLISLQEGKVISVSTDRDCLAILEPSAKAYKAHFISSPQDSEVWVAFFAESGSIELMRSTESTWRQYAVLQAGNVVDVATIVSIARTGFTSSMTWLAATATQAGVIMIWDLDSRECLHIFNDEFGQVDQIRVLPMAGKPCPSCGKMKPHSVVACFSTGDRLLIYQVSIPTGDMFTGCTCTPIVLEGPVGGRRSRTGSLTRSHTRRRSGNSGDSNGDSLAPFPVSAHGVHSRRNTSTQSDSQRLPGEMRLPTLDAVDVSKDQTQNIAWPSSDTTTPHYARAICRRVANVDVTRGVWDLYHFQAFGIRKRTPGSRSAKSPERSPSSAAPHASSDSPGYLPKPVLQKWEAFSLDLSNLDSLGYDASIYEDKALKISSLRSLSLRYTDSEHFDADAHERVPERLPFTRLSRSATSSSSGLFLAGLGNTLGRLKVEI